LVIAFILTFTSSFPFRFSCICPFFAFQMSAAAAWQQTQIIKSSIPHNLNKPFAVPILSVLPDIYIISIVRWDRCFFFLVAFPRHLSVGLTQWRIQGEKGIIIISCLHVYMQQISLGG